MFRTVCPSIIRSLRLYMLHQVYVIQVLWLLSSGNEADRPSETCTVMFQNKINLRYCASGWFYCRNILLSYLESSIFESLSYPD